MTPLYAFTTIMLVFAFGNMLAVKSKSIISMLFSVSVIFLIAFWTGLPVTIFSDSTLLQIGSMLIPILIAHIGTMLNVKELIQQWKTVVISLSAILGIVVLVVGVGQYIVGFETAVIASAPISGGVVAGIQMGQSAVEIGLPHLQILASLLVVIQGFIGYPLASYALKKEANVILEKYRSGQLVEEDADTQAVKATAPKEILEMPEQYRSDEWYLAKVGLVAMAAMIVSNFARKLAGFNVLDTNVLALILGVIAHQIGFLPKTPLNKANSNGLAMAALTVVVINSLSSATPQLLLDLLPSLLVVLGLGGLGIVIFSLIASKLLNVSLWMGIGIGASALFGFPGTFIVPGEVANTITDDPKEVEAVLKNIRPPMLVAGFVSVSIASVVLAGIMSSILLAR